MTDTKTKNTTEKKRKLIITAAIALALMLAALFATLAYLTSTTNTLDNVMTAGNITATIDERVVDEYGEPKEGVSPERTDSQQKYTMLPGHNYKKDPQIHIAQGSEPAWVFMVVNDPISSLEDTTSPYATTEGQMTADGTWTLLSDVALPSGLTGNVYAYKEIVDAKQTAQTVEGFKYFKLQSSLTDSQIAAYDGKSINATGIAIQSDSFTTAKAAWKAVYGEKVEWKSLKATVAETTVNYYPVLGGDNPQPDAFAYSTDGTTFTEITKPTGGYTMTGDVVTYAKLGQLYYKGEVNTVRSVNNISYDNTWDTTGASYSTPYHASTLKTGTGTISEKIDTTNEKVEKVTTQTSGVPEDTPAINGVNLTDIWFAYNSEKSSTGFGGQYGSFWSCVADSSDNAYDWDCIDSNWYSLKRARSDDFCVLVSREFS